MATSYIQRLSRRFRGRQPRRFLPSDVQQKGLGFWSGSLVVTDVIPRTPTVRTFRLADPAGKVLPFEFNAGQYLNLKFDLGGPTNRPYSISSPSSERRFVDLTIKREPHGLVSGHLFDKVVIGSVLAVQGPLGNFTIDRTRPHPVALLGAGVGVTPLVSMLKSLAAVDFDQPVHAIFGFRTEADGLFVRELQELVASHPSFKFDVTWSKPETPKSLVGRINPQLLRKLIKRPRMYRYYVCGPDQMMSTVTAGLSSLGVSDDLVHVETFTPPARDESHGGEFEIFFEPSAISVVSKPGESILTVAERAGVSIDFSCRTGTCGTCVAKLRRGSVQMLNNEALADDEIEDGYILTCQSFPKTNCSIRV